MDQKPPVNLNRKARRHPAREVQLPRDARPRYRPVTEAEANMASQSQREKPGRRAVEMAKGIDQAMSQEIPSLPHLRTGISDEPLGESNRRDDRRDDLRDMDEEIADQVAEQFRKRPDTPPRGRGRPPKQSTDDKIYSFLVQAYGGTGLLVGFVNQYDGQLIASKAEDCARGWLGVAKDNPSIYRVLKLISQNNSYIVLFFAHTGIILGIAANHQLMPATFMQRLGMAPPAPSPAQPEPHAPPQPTRPDRGGPLAGLSPEQMELVRQAAAAQIAASNIGPNANYNPEDILPHPEQNPAVLAGMIQRR